MKIIHCADLHLDSKLESNLTADKAKMRRDELLDTFERLVEFGEQQGVSAVHARLRLNRNGALR